jgi:hypothetical protein
MVERLIRTADDLDLWFTYLSGRKLPMTVSATEGLDRSAEQNRLMWKWATDVGQQTGEDSDEVQARWKLDHGLAVLCEDSQDYRTFCRMTLRPLTRQERLRAMEYTPVTSQMNVKQMVRFMDRIERECAEGGLVITKPDADLAAYNERHRRKVAA